MARYIDLDKAIERLKASPAFSNMGTDGYFLLDVVENLLNKQPTADVVPKSEVKKIFKEFERLMENNEVWFRQTDEIREEFAELKKKYTEGNNAGK